MAKKKLLIDLTQLEPLDHLDSEEAALHQALQIGEFEFQSDPKTVTKYAEIFKNNGEQRKAISLRIPKNDYFAIKLKASALGLPYQALINSLIHQYVSA